MRLLPALGVFLAVAAGLAQKSTGPSAKSGKLPVVSLGPLAAPKVSTQREGPKQVGRHRLLPKNSLRKGRWTSMPDGEPVWRLAIRSPGAQGIRIHFQAFDLGSGKVWIYPGDAAVGSPAGPYSSKGPNQDGEFWSDVVFGAEVVIEFRPVNRRAAGTLPSFRMSEISHLFEKM